MQCYVMFMYWQILHLCEVLGACAPIMNTLWGLPRKISLRTFSLFKMTTIQALRVENLEGYKLKKKAIAWLLHGNCVVKLSTVACSLLVLTLILHPRRLYWVVRTDARDQGKFRVHGSLYMTSWIWHFTSEQISYGLDWFVNFQFDLVFVQVCWWQERDSF